MQISHGLLIRTIGSYVCLNLFAVLYHSKHVQKITPGHDVILYATLNSFKDDGQRFL